MKRLAGASVLGMLLYVPTTVSAQASQATSQPSSDTRSEETRPATTTTSGTTGIWFVPTSEVLAAKKWSLSFYRTNIDDGQGFTDISTFPATFAVGLGNRAELFGNWALVTRLDRDTRPLFFDATNEAGTGGGLVVNYPLHRNQWSGNKLGDFTVGAKYNLLAGSSAPVGAAIQAMIKLPVGDDKGGASSGKTDFEFDGIVSTSNSVAEISGYAGVLFRGSPDGYELTNGLKWGVGAAFPQRNNLGFRVTAELFGEQYFDDTIQAPAGQVGADGSLVPITTTLKHPVVAALGLTWQAPNGFFIGGAGSWNIGMKSRDDAGFPNTPKDDMGLQIRIGYHPGAHDRQARSRMAAVTPPPVTPPPAAAPAAPPAPAPAPANRPPTVKASCNPCTVEVGRTAIVTADAQDPDGDPLTYQWTTGAGTLASPTSRQSNWTAPMQEGSVPFTVTVNDGRGGTASDSVTIQVIRATAQQFTFEDVHFEFDRFNLRPDALTLLNSAVTAMQANPALQLEIEGHTCNIGTPEYNLALGERRAAAVRDYLTSRGINASRLRTVSYGEERPKYDNSREDTRRLNRRAALVVRLQ